jgi:hypothetical protein
MRQFVVGERVSIYGKQGWKLFVRRYAPIMGVGSEQIEVKVFGEEAATSFGLKGEMTGYSITEITLDGERLSDL